MKTIVRGESGTSLTIHGTIAGRAVLADSRSEHVGPVLVGDDGLGYRLFLIGDNPLEQPTLARLAGKRVRVSGTWHNGVVRVFSEDLHVEE